MPPTPSPARHVAVMRILISAALLAAGFIMLSAPNFAIAHEISDGVQKLAAGWVGAVVGYWLS